MKTVDDDPMFDKKRAQKRLRSFVENNEYTVAQKAEMMVEHFHEQIIAKGKIGGQARAMVITQNIPRCVEYYYTITRALANRHSPYKAIIAYSGEYKYGTEEQALTCAARNGFPDAVIPKTFKTDQICSRPALTSRSCIPCMWTRPCTTSRQFRHFPV